MCFRLQVLGARRRRERRMEEELAAYARLDLRLPGGGDGVEPARQVSWLVAEKSPFRRAAMLVRDAEGRLVVAARGGGGDSAVEALKGWGGGVSAAGGGGVRGGEGE